MLRKIQTTTLQCPLLAHQRTSLTPQTFHPFGPPSSVKPANQTKPPSSPTRPSRLQTTFRHPARPAPPASSCSKNKPPQSTRPSKAGMTRTRRRARVGGTRTSTSLRATRSPAGTTPPQPEVRRAGATRAATVPGRITAPEWSRVVGVMMMARTR